MRPSTWHSRPRQQGHDPAPRRERHRQGRARQRHPRPQPTVRRSLPDSPLSKPVRGTARERTVRPRPQGHHRGSTRHGRQGGRGRRRLCFSTRSAIRRRPCNRNCSACCRRSITNRSGETRHAACDVAHRGRHQPRPGSRHRRRQVPRGPAVPAQRDRGDAAAAAPAAGPTCLPLAEHLLQFFARQSGKPLIGFTDEAEAAHRDATPGRATSASCATRSSVAVILAAGDAGRCPATCRRRLGPPPRTGHRGRRAE